MGHIVDIIGGESQYGISNNGDVYSYKRGGRILKPGLSSPKGGYLQVVLSLTGGTETHRNHVLVAKHFVPGYFVGAHVNHKDGNKTNNHHTNLEWVSIQENNRHSYENLVKAICKTFLVTFPCNTEKVVYNMNKFCREYSLSNSAMCLVSQGKRRHHKGFKCKLLETEDERRL